MDQIIERIKGLTAVLEKRLPLKEPYLQQLNNKFRLEFSFNSTHIEGSTLSYDEVALALVYGKVKGNHDLREYDEVRGHDVAYDRIKELVKEGRPLTESFIRDLNGLILVRPFYKKAKTLDGQDSVKEIIGGVYKDKSNSVQLPNGEYHYYATPEDTPWLMGELMQWYRNAEEAGDLHPVEIAATWHVKFVQIHPFDDGNGRIARLIMNYILMKNRLPPVIVKSADKNNYLAALQEADLGNVQPFIDYVATQLIWSLEISIRAAKGQSVDEIGDLKRKLFGLKRQLGELPMDEVIKKGPDAIRKVVDDVVIPFARTWEMVIRGFDSFFFSRKVYISIDGKRTNGTDMGLTMEEACSKVLYPILAEGGTITQITMYCDPKGLRPGNKDISLNGGKVEVFFFDHTFEIASPEANISENKLYNYLYTTEKLQEIAEKAGTFLYNVVVQNLSFNPRQGEGDDVYLMFTNRD